MTSETDITSLNRKHGNIKGQITKLANALKMQPLTSILEIQAKLYVISKLQDRFKILNEDYYKIEEEYKGVEAELDLVKDELQNLEVGLRTSLNKLKYDAESKSSAKVVPMKLPKIPLPTFSGRIEEWNLFKTQFNCLVSDNSQLSDNEKLHYLRGSLRREAKIIETSDDDFSSLFKALEQRYENKRVVVDCHIKNILSLQIIKRESSGDLRILLDNLTKNL